MSLIYEALRKSEEQRRLGETPTLTTPPLFATRPRRRAWPYLAAALGVVVLAGGTWWLGRLSSRETPATAVVATRAATTAAPPSAPSEGPSVAAPTPAATAPVAPASTPAPASSAAATAATSAPVPPALTPIAPGAATTPEDAEVRAGVPVELQRKLDSGEIFANSPAQLKPLEPTRDSSYVPPEAALPEPLPDLENAPPPAATPPAPSPATATAIPAPTAGIPAGGADAPTAPPPPAPAFIPSDPAASAASPPSDAAATLPYLFELPLATRREMPALKLNMHVYSADAARRFAIVDGTRAAEGSELASGLKVVEIRPDGAILEFRGQRFLLPRGN